MTRRPVTVSPSTPLDEAFALMDKHGFRHLPVVDGREVRGLVSDRDLVLGTGGLQGDERDAGEAGDLLPDRVEQVMRSPVTCVETHVRGPVAASHMVEQRIGALPVLQGGDLVGIVTETNLVSAFRDLCRDPAHTDELDRPVEEVMRSMVVTLSPQDTLVDAASRLTDWRIRHVPVMQDEDLVGMVSDRDIRMAFGRALILDTQAESEGRLAVDDRRIATIMTDKVVTIEPRQMLSESVGVMLEGRISALPVMVDGMLLGILTRTDVLEHYASVA